jgi:hypothetical protein
MNWNTPVPQSYAAARPTDDVAWLTGHDDGAHRSEGHEREPCSGLQPNIKAFVARGEQEEADRHWECAEHQDRQGDPNSGAILQPVPASLIRRAVRRLMFARRSSVCPTRHGSTSSTILFERPEIVTNDVTTPNRRFVRQPSKVNVLGGPVA